MESRPIGMATSRLSTSGSSDNLSDRGQWTGGARGHAGETIAAIRTTGGDEFTVEDRIPTPES